MERQKIEREHYRSSLLKRIIIRVDFCNLTDLAGFIGNLKKTDEFTSAFRSSKIVNMNEQVENMSSPFESNFTTFDYRFFNCLVEPLQSVTLDITINSICIDISCNEKYDCIDDYIKLMCVVTKAMCAYDSFVRFQRFGIRKIDGDDYTTLDDAYSVFEAKRFAHDDDFQTLRRVTSKYVGTELFKTENDVLCNLSRSVEVLSKSKIRFSLDIDTFIDERIVDMESVKTYEEVFNLLADRLNKTSFKIFREFVTEDFLNNGVVNYERRQEHK